jgi:hypothetical protein
VLANRQPTLPGEVPKTRQRKLPVRRYNYLKQALVRSALGGSKYLHEPPTCGCMLLHCVLVGVASLKGTSLRACEPRLPLLKPHEFVFMVSRLVALLGTLISGSHPCSEKSFIS